MADKTWQKIISPQEKIELTFSLGKRYLNTIRWFWFLLASFSFFLSFQTIKSENKIIDIIGFALLFLGFILAFYSLFGPWYLRKTNNFAFTNRRILVLRGWLSTKLMSVEFDKITNIQVEQKILEKIFFNTGSLIIDTAGTSSQEIIITNIEEPYKIKAKLDELMSKP